MEVELKLYCISRFIECRKCFFSCKLGKSGPKDLNSVSQSISCHSNCLLSIFFFFLFSSSSGLFTKAYLAAVAHEVEGVV